MKKLKGIAVALFFALLLYGKFNSLDVSAYGTYQYGNLYYTLTDNGDAVEITGCKSGVTNITIPTQIDDMDVVSIGWGAFSENETLTSVTMESVEKVDRYAFYSCPNLKWVYAPKLFEINGDAFRKCNKLSDITIAQIKKDSGYIDSSAFAYCISIKSLNVGNIKRIGMDAFLNCTALENIDGSLVSSVYYSAFEGCIKLTSIDMPKVTDVGFYAFKGCTALKTVKMSNVEIIEENAFRDCTSLVNVYMPKVTKIQNYAFVNTNITKVGFSKDVTLIGEYALGYDYYKDKYDRDIWTKKAGFTIHCSKSGNIYAYAIDNGFKYENHSLKIKSEIKTTCTKDGKKVEYCPTCGYQKITKTSRYGHAYNSGIITKKPTNTKNGLKTYTCKRCKATKTSTLKAYKTLATGRYKKYIDGLYDCKYKIIDVDKNGIPELLIKDFDNWEVRAYTYNPTSSKMVKLKTLRYGKGGILEYNTTTHYLGFVTGDTGGYTEYIYKLSGVKLKKVTTIKFCNGKFEKEGYKINKKRVSTKKYKKYYKKRIKSFKKII